MLEMFQASVRRAPDQVALRYFDGELTVAQLDQASDALALTLLDRGFQPGDRLAVYVQNNPGFVVGLLGAWKAGGGAVAINPMNKGRELAFMLTDSGATALLCLDELYPAVVRDVIASRQTRVGTVITTSELDWQTRDDERVLRTPRRPVADGTLDLLDIVAAHDGRRTEASAPKPDDIAVLTYTSGTTGRPKGAMNTHGTMVYGCYNFREWLGLTSRDSVLGIAPLFHITGLVGHVGLALLLPCPLVLAHRFHPAVVLDALREHRPTFTVAAITALTRLAEESSRPAEDFSSLRIVYSGGAPIAPAVNEAFEARTGIYIHNIYGLTETNAPTHATPLGATAPVDPASGALSIGVPVFGTVVRILGDDGEELPVGQVGEIAISGPQVIPGYWNRPEESAAALPGGELRTGDVGFMDEEGWFYLVDRKKDMINASGYKVWPREVEDLLYTHPAIREVAVVGVPDTYRGETVKAFVSLHPGVTATPDEIIQYAKENMAAYKYPRLVEIVDELPRTTTGKILRRRLRDNPPQESASR
ncbi:class I adenylate-forming enzyme family protein [Streptomyces griseorubiginosus]|uniref:class I adenylate-forming enzyme family protein n=1 Tax=Streptomyces griseorubiginosus TaxID=67304 RepID=UPI001FCBEE18|nr:AMP-binding protein [Streptomyces griseorubiginosus]MBO4252333.1 AMP-binding protein [Streptomyces griseorubiginosus]